MLMPADLSLYINERETEGERAAGGGYVCTWPKVKRKMKEEWEGYTGTGCLKNS